MENYPHLNQKNILITGGTGGIGLAAAVQLAQSGPRITLVGRSPERAQKAVQAIQQKTGNQQIDFINADLSIISEVRQMVDAYKAQHDHLDVLINNAGGFFWDTRKTQDGREMTWALNHLNYFLTTKLLLDCLKTNPNGGRIINVSSNAHITGKVDVQALRDGRVKGGWTTYADTKLANILFTNELARRLQGTNITANAMHPGFVATSFGHDNRGVLSWLLKLSQKVFARTPEEGAKTVTYLAASPEVQGVTGKYFVDCRPATPIPAARNPETARELWEWSEAITVEKMPA